MTNTKNSNASKPQSKIAKKRQLEILLAEKQYHKEVLKRKALLIASGNFRVKDLEDKDDNEIMNISEEFEFNQSHTTSKDETKYLQQYLTDTMGYEKATDHTNNWDIVTNYYHIWVVDNYYNEEYRWDYDEIFKYSNKGKTVKQRYFHVTCLEDYESILEKGLEGRCKNQIFLISNLESVNFKDIKNIAGYIALNQVFLKDYVLLEILPEGITGKIIPDNVGEQTARFQVIIKQNKIEAQFINLIDFYKIINN